MEQASIQNNETVDNRRRNIGGMALLGLTGTAVIGLYAATFPFITPALRRMCLPYVPATTAQVKNVMSALRNKHGKVVDLGSGDGRIVIEAAKNGFLAEGVELNFWLVLYSRWSAWQQGVNDRTRFLRQDLWKVDLSTYNNVVIFGIQEMMEELERKADRELSPTASIIACRFPLPNRMPTAVVGSGIDTVWIYGQKQPNVSHEISFL